MEQIDAIDNRHVTGKVLNWASLLEDKAREQAMLTSTLPFIHPHLALMPDAHWGMGATVGSVIPTIGAIIPAAVGVDIGCGMIAVRTQFHLNDLPPRRAYRHLREGIEHAVPAGKGGVNGHIWADHTGERLSMLRAAAIAQEIDLDSYSSDWEFHLGSLGSGNHFIEVSLDEENNVWLFLHSGSRGIGNRMAMRHIKVAKALMKKWHIDLPEPDLAYLVEGTDEFWDYMKCLRWAQEFALMNRAEMMDRVVFAFSSWVGGKVDRMQEINCHHNYTERERHYGKEVWLSRKGAINAELGRPGLIPGSMGTRSYVVTGKGYAPSLNSSPHGAGRMRSRGDTRRQFSMEDFEAEMGDVEFRHTEALIDEMPSAYKPIDRVMEDAFDLVQVEHELRQIINCKGD